MGKQECIHFSSFPGRSFILCRKFPWNVGIILVLRHRCPSSCCMNEENNTDMNSWIKNQDHEVGVKIYDFFQEEYHFHIPQQKILCSFSSAWWTQIDTTGGWSGPEARLVFPPTIVAGFLHFGRNTASGFVQFPFCILRLHANRLVHGPNQGMEVQGFSFVDRKVTESGTVLLDHPQSTGRL